MVKNVLYKPIVISWSEYQMLIAMNLLMVSLRNMDENVKGKFETKMKWCMLPCKYE